MSRHKKANPVSEVEVAVAAATLEEAQPAEITSVQEPAHKPVQEQAADAAPAAEQAPEPAVEQGCAGLFYAVFGGPMRNPFTNHVFENIPVPVAEIDGWLRAQIDAGKIAEHKA